MIQQHFLTSLYVLEDAIHIPVAEFVREFDNSKAFMFLLYFRHVLKPILISVCHIHISFAVRISYAPVKLI